jgi:hypothetical protein
MKREVIGVCPVCSANLLATKLSCNQCHTEISGEFTLSKFSYLNRDELYFVETFIRVQGNIKEMERELNVSYPTVKKNLDAIITKLGFAPVKPVQDDEAEILAKLKNKEISVDEALDLLRK